MGDKEHKISVLWSNDKITLDSLAHRVQYDGRELSVEDKFIVSIPHCGLCGDADQDKRGDLKSADQCVYRSIKAMDQSFRIEDAEVISEITPRDKQVLQEEEALYLEQDCPAPSTVCTLSN